MQQLITTTFQLSVIMKIILSLCSKAIVLVTFLFCLLTTTKINAQWSEVGGTNTSTFNNEILIITTDGIGNVYAAGIFTNTNGYNYVAKWNGSSWSELGGANTSTFNSDIESITTDANGHVYAAGYFTNKHGNQYVAVWNGSSWGELGGTNTSTFNNYIWSITTDGSGNLYAGGFFTNTNGYNYVAKWNGSRWGELGGTNTSSFNSNVVSITIDVNNNIYAGGHFTNTNGNNYVAKWNGNSWGELGGTNTSTFNGIIQGMTTDGSGNLYAAGEFTNTNSKYYVAKWNGSRWGELGGTNTSTFNKIILRMTTDVSGDVYAVGYFTNMNGNWYVAKWNGSNWGELGGINTSTFNNFTRNITTDKKGNIYVAGQFTNGNGNFYVAKYSPFGTPPPSILSFTPNGTCPGVSIPVFITGTNLEGATAVTVGGAAVDSFTVNSARSITAYISNGTTGKIVVTTPNGTATSDSVFTFGKGYTAYAYAPNWGSNTVSVINATTNQVAATIPVGTNPYGVSVNPDGSKVYVTNYGSNIVSIINTTTNTVVGNIPVGNGPSGIKVSPDGKMLYVVNNNNNSKGSVSFVNTVTNTVTTTIPVGNNPYGVAISPDGKTIYVSNWNDNNVDVINTQTNLITATLAVGKNPSVVNINSDGSLVYVANNTSNNVSVINTATQSATTFATGNGTSGIGFSPDGSKIYVSNDIDGTVSIYNSTNYALIATVAVGNFPQGVSVSPDGSEVYVSNFKDGTVSVINTVSNTLAATVKVGNSPVSFGNFIANVPTPCTTPPSPTILSFTPNGTCPGTSIPVFITGSNLENATAVTVGGAAVDSFTVNDSSSITAYISKGTTGKIAVTSPNGTATSDSVFTFGLGHTAYAYVANLDDGTVSVINTTIDKVVATIPVGANPWGVSASADGTRVYVTNVGNNVMVNGTVSVINTATNTVIATVTVGRVPYGICVSPDGQRVYVTNLYYNSLTGIDSVSVINTATYQVIATIPVGNNPYGVSTSPDGTKLFVADSIVRIINTATNTVIAAVPVGGEGTEVAVSPDGSKVYVSVANDSTLVVINSANYSMMATDSVGYNPYGVCISPDGTKVYVANQQDSITLTVVNTITNKAIATVAGGYEPDDISITPDGTKVYMPNPIDNTVHVINTATNAVIAIIPVGNTPYAFGNFIANVPNPTPCSLPPPPIITSFKTPVCPGTIDTIKGSGFTGATFVLFGKDTASTFRVINDSTIAAVVDSGASGSVQVNTPNGKASLAGFIYLSPTKSTTNDSICKGSSFTFNGKNYDLAGTYTAHLTNSVGCDSTATLILTIKDSSSSTTSATICKGSSFTFNSKSYDSAGTYTSHLTNSVGCDSTATLILTIKDSSSSTTSATICKGSSFTFNSKSYDSAGTYTSHLTNSVGCDSTATLVLSINQPTTSTTDTSICQGNNFTFNNITYDSSGTFISHLTNSAGCDSTATLVLTVRNPDTSYTKGSFCKTPYIFNGTSYDSVGTFTAHLTTVAGCDSIAILTLTKDSSQNLLGIGTELNQVCLNQFDTLTDMTLGGTWKSLDPTIASIDSIGTVNGVSVGLVKGLSVGTANITYTISSSCGTETTPPQAIQVIGIKPTVDTIIHNATCINPESGSVALSIIGSEGPYQDSINGNWYTVYDTLTNLGAGSYSIYIKNSLGCMVDTLPDVTISVIDDASCYALYVPTGFVPTTTNPTGATKLLKPFGGSSAVQAITFRVYNRFGGLVFESHDLISGWDGTINGTLQDTGTYVWMLEYTINNIRKFDKGTSTLIR